MAATLSVEVRLGDVADLSPEEVDELTHALCEELSAAGADELRPATVPAPAGARSGEATALGVVLMAIAPALIQHAAATIQAWLSRAGHRSVVLTKGETRLEVTALPSADMKELAERFIDACIDEDREPQG